MQDYICKYAIYSGDKNINETLNKIKKKIQKFSIDRI